MTNFLKVCQQLIVRSKEFMVHGDRLDKNGKFSFEKQLTVFRVLGRSLPR